MSDAGLSDADLSDEDLAREIAALLDGETDLVANAANVASVLFHRLDRVNWAGFYFNRDGTLVLGPFQGRPACVRIPLGSGVCGAAAERRETIVVPDVHAFPGHIACDASSRSEIVVPLLRGGDLVGVLDVDSPEPDRFGDADRSLLERVADLLMAA